jgi:hypothetical protein
MRIKIRMQMKMRMRIWKVVRDAWYGELIVVTMR